MRFQSYENAYMWKRTSVDRASDSTPTIMDFVILWKPAKLKKLASGRIHEYFVVKTLHVFWRENKGIRNGFSNYGII